MSDSKSRIDRALKTLAFDYCGTPEQFVKEARAKFNIAVDPAYAATLIDNERRFAEWRRR